MRQERYPKRSTEQRVLSKRQRVGIFLLGLGLLTGCKAESSDREISPLAIRDALTNVESLRALGLCADELAGDLKLAEVSLRYAPNSLYKSDMKERVELYKGALGLARRADVPCEPKSGFITTADGVNIYPDSLTDFDVRALKVENVCAEELRASLAVVAAEDVPKGNRLYEEEHDLAVAALKHQVKLAALHAVGCE